MIGLTVLSFAQDSAYSKQKMTNRKVGIYADYEEFLKNEPSITKSFIIMPIFYIDSVKKDSIIVGLTYRFQDSSKLIKKVWGLYDGEKTYYNLDYLFLVPFSYTARYSMFIQDTGTQVMTYNGSVFTTSLLSAYANYEPKGSNLLSLGLGLLTGNPGLIVNSIPTNFSIMPTKIKKKTVMYINRKGILMDATDETIGFFLRHERDLSQAFNKEKKSTADVYIQYIMAMNARYPL
jgi:hypothetical protein